MEAFTKPEFWIDKGVLGIFFGFVIYLLAKYMPVIVTKHNDFLERTASTNEKNAETNRQNAETNRQNSDAITKLSRIIESRPCIAGGSNPAPHSG